MIIPREYQQNIAQSILKKGNTLIVLPTGMGKTLIGAIVVEHYLRAGGKALFLAPTRPLIAQHAQRLREYIGAEPVEITGEISSKKRRELYQNSPLIVSTPQCIKNDLKMGPLKGVSVVIFDEAHRSVGKYAYTKVAEAAKESGALIVGLTASPGGKFEKIREIMSRLFINNVEIRTGVEPDVMRYIQPIEIKWIYVELSEQISKACEILNSIKEEKISTLKELGIKISKSTTRQKLSQIYESLIKERNLVALAHFSKFYLAFHGIELLQTQGPHAFSAFIERARERGKRIDKRMLHALEILKGEEHPKMAALIDLVSANCGKKLIVFAQYRDQVHHIVDALCARGFCARHFLGKAESTQEEQKKTIEAFSKGEFNILVCSSIGEEGIDVPSADVVIFYEPIPSEIRTIQRRGRVGRLKGGQVFVLVTKGTLDETFRWVAAARERRMHKIVRAIREKGEKGEGEKGQPKIVEFIK